MIEQADHRRPDFDGGTRRREDLGAEVWERQDARLKHSRDIWHRREQSESPIKAAAALLFPNENGDPLVPGNIRRRILRPLVEEVNAPWAGFHTFRYTSASIHLAEGTNLLQLSRALGHHSAALTLSWYTHLRPGDEAPALEVCEFGQNALVLTVAGG